jgi:hypothetical protein
MKKAKDELLFMPLMTYTGTAIKCGVGAFNAIRNAWKEGRRP